MTVLVTVVTAAFTAWLVAGGPAAGSVSTIATFVVAAAAGIAALRRAVRRPGPMRRAWIGVGLGSLSYAFGEAAWTWTETFQGGHVTLPSLPDAGYLGMMPLMAAGLLAVPARQRSVTHRIRAVVDGLLIAASLLLVSWIFVIHPLLLASSELVLAYPAGDILLVTIVLSLFARLRRGDPDGVPLILIGAGILLLGASDTLYAYVTLDALYVPGSPIDAGWFAGFAAVLIAALRPDPPAAPSTGRSRPPLAALLPYAAVLAALLVGVVWYAEPERDDPVYSWSRSALILLIVARQLLTLMENRQLTTDLEARVTRRTRELYVSEQRFRALVQHSSESVAVIDADTTIRYQSDSIERIFGIPAESLVGHRLLDLLDREPRVLVADAVRTVQAAPYASTVITVQMPHATTGELRQAEITVTNLLDDPNVAGIVLNTRDVSEAAELQDRLLHEAYHDALTGLASRALFRDRLEEAIGDSAEDVAILLLDLDGFQDVNDSLGHSAGDALLVQVAERLRSQARGTDTVSRFGGDEFAVLVRSIVARADAETIAKRIAGVLDEPFVVDGRELHVGASIGLASGADASDVEQLMRNADLAMYRAKTAGGAGFASYDPRMHDALVQRLELEADLRVALERDELTLHYQPTVALASGEIVGFEALVRWNHPVRGIVSPLEFIGIAEATGLIVPLGRWVLAEACRQAVAWGAGSTRRLKMAVNVSVRQFERCDLAELVAGVLAETGMPAGQLCLEMTESVLLTDTDENLEQLVRLKALGVELAIDDFGTGFSSLAYLRRFPMDVLKIDRSFVDRLGGDPEDEALVRTIVRLGRSLGMSTVAEGIEDRVQLAALQVMGCEFAQGYLLSRPVAAPEAGALLRAGLPLLAAPLAAI